MNTPLSFLVRAKAPFHAGGLNGPVHSAIGAALSGGGGGGGNSYGNTDDDLANSSSSSKKKTFPTTSSMADCLVTVTSIVACALSLVTFAASGAVVRFASPAGGTMT